jgi:UPF0755 protein
MTKRRQNPYQEKKAPTGTIIWILRLVILFVVVTAVVTAVIILYNAIQGMTNLDRDRFTANPDLNPIERLALENYLSSHSDALDRPVGQGTETVLFTIESGQSANQVAQNLAAAGLLSDTEQFLNYVRYQGLDAKLVAGSFRLAPQLTIPELALTLTQSQILEVEMNFLFGWRLEEMAAYLDTIKPAEIDAQQFLALAQRPQLMSLDEFTFLNDLPPEATLEGFLLPGSYRISTDIDAAALIRLMLSRFDEQIDPTMRQLFAAQDLTLYEAVILASIVEREAVDKQEQPLIASVFHNRIELEMLLQADPTIQYAIGVEGAWWKSPLDISDISANSPYNTYLHPGLPPGPIANPSLSAIQAVATPQTSDFLFFVADCTPGSRGRHLFSKTYDEHLANVGLCNIGN